jgi:hypothetical protein
MAAIWPDPPVLGERDAPTSPTPSPYTHTPQLPQPPCSSHLHPHTHPTLSTPLRRLNNVEQVALPVWPAGAATVAVTGQSVFSPGGRQEYALVATGDFE